MGEPKEKKMLCPLSLAAPGYRECEKERCAWWIRYLDYGNNKETYSDAKFTVIGRGDCAIAAVAVAALGSVFTRRKLKRGSRGDRSGFDVGGYPF